MTERFAKAYSEQVGSWCQGKWHQPSCRAYDGGTYFTVSDSGARRSHAQSAGTILLFRGSTCSVTLRNMRAAKQAESICHQYGKDGVVSELYGVTNWDFDFQDINCRGDWQAALGITHRVHHLNWMSMGGKQRDYPAAIGFNLLGIKNTG